MTARIHLHWGISTNGEAHGGGRGIDLRDWLKIKQYRDGSPRSKWVAGIHYDLQRHTRIVTVLVQAAEIPIPMDLHSSWSSAPGLPNSCPDQ